MDFAVEQKPASGGIDRFFDRLISIGARVIVDLTHGSEKDKSSSYARARKPEAKTAADGFTVKCDERIKLTGRVYQRKQLQVSGGGKAHTIQRLHFKTLKDDDIVNAEQLNDIANEARVQIAAHGGPLVVVHGGAGVRKSVTLVSFLATCLIMEKAFKEKLDPRIWSDENVIAALQKVLGQLPDALKNNCVLSEKQQEQILDAVIQDGRFVMKNMAVPFDGCRNPHEIGLPREKQEADAAALKNTMPGGGDDAGLPSARGGPTTAPEEPENAGAESMRPELESDVIQHNLAPGQLNVANQQSATAQLPRAKSPQVQPAPVQPAPVQPAPVQPAPVQLQASAEPAGATGLVQPRPAPAPETYPAASTASRPFTGGPMDDWNLRDRDMPSDGEAGMPQPQPEAHGHALERENTAPGKAHQQPFSDDVESAQVSEGPSMQAPSSSEPPKVQENTLEPEEDYWQDRPPGVGDQPSPGAVKHFSGGARSTQTGSPRTSNPPGSTAPVSDGVTPMNRRSTESVPPKDVPQMDAMGPGPSDWRAAPAPEPATTWNANQAASVDRPAAAQTVASAPGPDAAPAPVPTSTLGSAPAPAPAQPQPSAANDSTRSSRQTGRTPTTNSMDATDSRTQTNPAGPARSQGPAASASPFAKAGRSPQTFAQFEKVLLEGLDSGNGVFQILDPTTHRQPYRGGENKTVILQLFAELERTKKAGQKMVLDGRYEVHSIEEIDTPFDHVGCISLTFNDLKTGNQRSVVITQVGLRFDDNLLRAADIKTANDMLAVHRNAVGTLADLAPAVGGPSATVPRTSDPMIFSESGMGRNATLICYREALAHLDELQDQASVDRLLKQIVANGSQDQGRGLIQSKKQWAELRAAVSIEFARRQGVTT